MMNMDICCEIQKIPNLMTHFAEHQSDDGDSFVEFLFEDYIDHGSAENHHDEKDHDDLPFHGNHQCQHTNVFYSTTPSFILEVECTFIEGNNIAYVFSLSSSDLDTPFQPPQYI
jgi:hypothetical protein